jgi:integrase
MFQENGSARRTPASLDPKTRLSEAAAKFLADQENQAGNRLRTLQEYSTAIWYVIEFAGADLAVEQLPADFARRWIEWLRMTPWSPRKPWTRPRRITAETVSAFLAWPPFRELCQGLRREQTIGRYWRHGRPFLASLGLDVRLPKKRRGSRRDGGRDHAPRLALPPPLVPRRSDVIHWWRETLDPGNGPARASLRRRVVLMQGLVLLTGCRIGELLAAQQALVDGHWLLLHPDTVKTGRPRLVYLTGQALAIGQTLRRWTDNGQMVLFDAGDRFAGWPHTASWWHKQVKCCLPATAAGQRGEADKRHQGLRKACSTWLELRDPVAEAAQLGHGRGDVVSTHYLDVLRRLPRRMEYKPMRLPELPGFAWPAPIDARREVPKRLYEQFRRLVEE